jgi:hypothetical protein
MDQKDKAVTKKGEAISVLILLAFFLIWCPTYVFVVRPMINAWLSSYVSGYPAMLHLIPILAPVIVLAWVLSKIFPDKSNPPKRR